MHHDMYAFPLFQFSMKTTLSDSIFGFTIQSTFLLIKNIALYGCFLKCDYFIQVVLILCISLYFSLYILAVAISVPCSVLSQAVCYVKVVCPSLSAARML